ncbi:kinesin-like protein KIN-12D isoform X2 [Impatiens glandulifera]|uniref:kinesin-like protein KIN-12D isoform X2 n=1 Tax=Impatiens glandulifera TaxID=253017 RepID=UPI001FB17984|nr:kinesin-like protein KIN-12D isoform X2 [Impatiens glandulifera]
MLRDYKYPRRNSKSLDSDEIENVPVNPRDSLGSQTSVDLTRPPLNTIQEPSPSKLVLDQEHGFKNSKVDRTPTKTKRKSTDSLQTPDNPFLPRKNRFGWAQKNESSEVFEEGRFDFSNYAVSQSSRGAGGSLAPMTTPRSTKTVGRANSEFSSTQSTPTKSVSKPLNPAPMSVPRPPVNGAPRIGSYAALSKGPSTVVNTVEVPHFDLKEDPSFWMDHSVQVLIRVRPLNSMEKGSYGYNRCLKQESVQSITWIGQPETRFTFDHVACETINQETLFRMVGLPIVENCLSGYNSCMFAYGQTGSGKTHTMLGEIDELQVRPSPNRGMTPRTFEFLFARIRAEEESRRDEKLKYNCKCSFLEIYNEQITDLLDPSSTNLSIREDVKKGVYVENLSEFEVQTVGDILTLLSQGSSNRRVAATNMNRESSRSHSVFTCVIESRWEKDNNCNLRFARLNLVDLAGSERQKSSGAEGERLKEAANINKSLSTLGHVIMVLVDVANGKMKHIPYRDSRLTFLLQDSLGGNSKTMIIANISPSICCAAETLNTLKFAQRAKLIQNNAIVNEDSSGDVIVLQHQILLLKEELSSLKRQQNVSRSLSFGMVDRLQYHENACNDKGVEIDQQHCDTFVSESKDVLMLSSKQLRSLETTLAGALRREQMSDTTIKQLEAEMEQLNRLVNQREEDTRCTKMMLKFREEKIQRLESLVGGLIPPDAYLQQENTSLSEEIELLKARLERNPEVTRFARENIRLLEQLRRFQDFYEEGEREMLLSELSQLREQMVYFLDVNLRQQDHPQPKVPPLEAVKIIKETESLQLQLNTTLKEMEDYKTSLTSCLENNARLRNEVNELRGSLNGLESAPDCSTEVIKEPIIEAKCPDSQYLKEVGNNDRMMWHETIAQHSEELVDLQLELDILKIVLREERSSYVEMEEKEKDFHRDLELVNRKLLLMTEQYENVKAEHKDATTVIEALESQQLLSIHEIEDLRNKNNLYARLLKDSDLEISSLKEKIPCNDASDPMSSNHLEGTDSPLQTKLKKMQESLEKAKRINIWYQKDRSLQACNEEEMDEVRRQAEAETAEVIVSLQDELNILQQQVNLNNQEETESKDKLMHLQADLEELHEKSSLMAQDNERLNEELQRKDEELRALSEHWELLIKEIETDLVDGHTMLDDASHQIDIISSSLPQKRAWISEQVCNIQKVVAERDLRIEDLKICLNDVNEKRNDMESMLRSLRGATLVITEAHQQDCMTKEKEIMFLKSQLSSKVSTSAILENQFMQKTEQLQKVSKCALVAFVIVNRLSEVNSMYSDELKLKDAFIHEQAAEVIEAQKQVLSLSSELSHLEETSVDLRLQLAMEKKHAGTMEQKLEDIQKEGILKMGEKVTELQNGVSELKSCMNISTEIVNGQDDDNFKGNPFPMTSNLIFDSQAKNQMKLENNILDIEDVKADVLDSSLEVHRNIPESTYEQRAPVDQIIGKDRTYRDATIILLRKEIEYALGSLKEVKAEMTKLRQEKDEALMSEKQSREKIKCLHSQLLSFEATVDNYEQQTGQKVTSLDHKLKAIQELVQETSCCWCRERELLEFELCDAKVEAEQRNFESSCILAKFEEAQDTMKEADIVINGLMIANETVKLKVEEMKKMESTLTKENNALSEEVQSLKSSCHLKDGKYQVLKEQYASDLEELKKVVVELDCIISCIMKSFMEDYAPVANDILCLKSQFKESMKLMHTWIEDVWSEIIVKDSAVSVLHLCHMGILLETVTGLNAENGLLDNGLAESNSVISELREHNSKSRDELEMCRTLKGKLLADIKKGFDRITIKEDETSELKMTLDSFEKKISDLQSQEELMLHRSKYMGSELSFLIKELDLSNSVIRASLSDQEKLLKGQEEELKLQEENLLLSLCMNDLESLILMSEIEQMAYQKANAEAKSICSATIFEDLKREMVLLEVDAAVKEHILLDKEDKHNVLQKEFDEAQSERQRLNLMISENNFELSEMRKRNKALNQDVQVLKDSVASNDNLKSKLNEVLETNVRLSFEVQELEAVRENLIYEIKARETGLEDLKSEMVLLSVYAAMKEHIWLDKEDEHHILQKEFDEAQHERHKLNLKISQNNFEISEMRKRNEALNQDVQVLKDSVASNDNLKNKLNEVLETNVRLSLEVQKLEVVREDLTYEIKARETALEDLKREMVLLEVDSTVKEHILLDKKDEHNVLQKEFDEAQRERQGLNLMISQNSFVISEMRKTNEALNQDVQVLKDSVASNDNMKRKLNEVLETNVGLSLKVQELEAVRENLIYEIKARGTALENSSESIRELEAVHESALQDLEEKRSQLASIFDIIHSINLQNDHDKVNAEMKTVQLSQSVAQNKLSSKTKDLQKHIDRFYDLKEQNTLHCVNSVENMSMLCDQVFNLLTDESTVLEKIFKEVDKELEMTSVFTKELDCLEKLADKLISENLFHETELSRKDEILKGLLFDLSLLQESASNAKDQKDEIKELTDSLHVLEGELINVTYKLDGAVANGQVLENQLEEKLGIICSLQLEIAHLSNSSNLLSVKNHELTSEISHALQVKISTEEELFEIEKVNESLERQVIEVSATIGELNYSVESLKATLNSVSTQRDDLQAELLIMKEKLETTEALAEENKTIATEAHQTAETMKQYAEEKEKEVKLLEKSVEELEYIINVLETKVDIVKGEAERQTLEREELEMELHVIKQQMNNISSNDTDIKRHLDVKENKLQEAIHRMQVHEKEIASKDSEIAQFKTHIAELNLHAEAQALEYKQKFKALEEMAEQVKTQGQSLSLTNVPSSSKLEKNGSKPKGSGSPFKCIGLGLAQQVKSENHEELTAGRFRIEELEALAASRQKEIFTLKAKLASTESMTHDVIRDLLGIKLDMTNYASLMDQQQVQKIAEKSLLHSIETQEPEVIKLRQQLNEFVEERKGWLEEIDRKQAELVAAQVALEKLHQRDRLLSAENGIFKMENANHKKKISELEDQVYKLSGQQNLQQRIHHHAKIKEENNILRSQNDEFCIKLRRTESILSRARDELAHYREMNGKSPHIDYDEEQRLSNMLKETEEERLELAQKLVGLCTSVLKAAGMTISISDVSIPLAEEALQQLMNRVSSLDRELEDVKFKNRITNERIKLSELVRPGTDENQRTPNTAPQAPFLSSLDP